MMDNYVSYKEIPTMLGLKAGDILYISSDVTRLIAAGCENGELFGLNDLIDAFVNTIGGNGTILIPTFNWDFCHDVPFNYKKTWSRTGLLGQAALKRPDFRRTRHPIYSFAVYGKDQDLLCNMDNITSFGPDSPFAYLEKNKAHNLIIDVPYNHCFTFMHYMEQKTGVIYRYEKTFTGEYTDENGIKSVRSYSMYVRDLDMDVVNDMTEMGKELEARGISQKRVINGVDFKIVDLVSCVPLFKDDILNNRSRKICRFKGQ